MSKSGDWYMRENEGKDEDAGFDEWVAEQEFIAQCRKDAEKLILDDYEERFAESFKATTVAREDFREAVIHDLGFFETIWKASTETLPNLEVQVVVDGKNNCFVTTGSSGYVEFGMKPPVGMVLPIRCWIHTHPFGSAYFSGTDINTVTSWLPLMEQAYVLGGEGHYGFWEQRRPNELDVYVENSLDYTQIWDDNGRNLDEEEE